MLTKETPDTVKASLKIKAQGVEKNLMLTYHNHDADEYEKFISNPENLKVPEGLSEAMGITTLNALVVLFLVKSFDDGTDQTFPLNMDGLVALERTWPGVLVGIHRGYHQSRAADVQKN